MTSDPHESADHLAMAPAADSTAPDDRTKARIKIGSQRAGAPPPRVPPRVKTVFSTPEPESSVGVPPSGGIQPTAAGLPAQQSAEATPLVSARHARRR